MITRTNHGAAIDLDIPRKEPTKYRINGMKWTEPADGLVHKIGLADGENGTVIIATELDGVRRALRLSPRAVKFLTTLLIKHVDDHAGDTPPH